MTPKEHCRKAKMSLADFAEIAHAEGFSKCSKAALSLASDPLTGVVAGTSLKRLMGYKDANRAKPHKYTLRMSESWRDEFEAAKAHFGHETDQEAIERAIFLYVTAYKREARKIEYIGGE